MVTVADRRVVFTAQVVWWGLARAWDPYLINPDHTRQVQFFRSLSPQIDILMYIKIQSP
jgi:hypothetical protein